MSKREIPKEPVRKGIKDLPAALERMQRVDIVVDSEVIPESDGSKQYIADIVLNGVKGGYKDFRHYDKGDSDVDQADADVAADLKRVMAEAGFHLDEKTRGHYHFSRKK